MNYMAEVAKMLGVELYERFQIINLENNIPISDYNYYFTDKDIEIDDAGHGCSGEYILINLVYGDFAIKRKPWKPKDGDKFWYVDADEVICSYVDFNHNDADHVNYYKLGNCYRTREEAEANRDKWIAFYKSDEVLEV